MMSGVNVFFASMIMVWHIHRIMHVWRWCDHMLMVCCVNMFKRVIGISLVVMIGLAIHIIHAVSHPFFQVAISYVDQPVHEPIHLKEKMI